MEASTRQVAVDQPSPRKSSPIMFTRFRTSEAVYVLESPKIPLAPNAAGAPFLILLGQSYECEEEVYRLWLIRNADDLKSALEADVEPPPNASRFVAGLKLLLEFLSSIPDDAVFVYSYDRAPIPVLLDAFRIGGGMSEWALEDLRKRGEKGCLALRKLLQKEKDPDRLLAAISMLLMLDRGEETIAAIQKMMLRCDPETGKHAAALLQGIDETSSHRPPPER